MITTEQLATLNIEDGISPELWGAKADGITDCTLALNECVKWACKQKGKVVIKLKSGVYRITDTWIVGNKWAEESLFYNNFSFTGSQTGVNVSEYQKSRWSNIVSIEGTGQTCLYLDFADTTKLKAGIIYTLQGDGRYKKGYKQYNASISGIGFYGKGTMINNVPNDTILNETYKAYTPNNSVGLICSYNIYLALKDLVFYGLKDGLVRNNSYFSEITNIRFEFCDRGYFDWQSHSSQIHSMFGSYCNKAFEVRSSQMVFNNIGTSGGGIGLHIGSGSNLFNGVYLESFNSGEAQIIIGDNLGDPYYKAGYPYLVDSTDINMVTVVANNADKTTGVSLKMNLNARRLYLNRGSMQSSFKVYALPENKVFCSGVLGMTNTANSVVIN